jgi:hypothetical protein
MKAKIKQQYAKVLKEEGMESTRLAPRGDGQAGRVRTLEKGKGKGKGKARDEDSDDSSSEDEGKGVADPNLSFAPVIPVQRIKSRQSPNRPYSETPVQRSVRALSPSDVGPPLSQTSLRSLKREAFAKYHPPPVNRLGRAGSGRGQPNLGARMNVLLETIKRDKQG